MKPTVREYLDRAEEFLGAAEALVESKFFSIATGRAYYAMFHAVTAALLARGIQRSSHHGTIAAFGEFLVKPGLVEKRFHTWLQNAFEGRGDGDYSPVPTSDPEIARIQIERAREFIRLCRQLCES